MATQYVIHTNSIKGDRHYSSKAKALAEARMVIQAAEMRSAGDVVQVRTVTTSKVVFEFVAPVSESVVMPVASWEVRGPILSQLDGCMPACYWEDSRPIVAVWFDAIGHVEGACAAHMRQVESFPHTMLPNALETAGMVIMTPSVPEAQIVIDAYRDDVSVEEISGMLTGELRHAFFVEDKSIEEIIAMARDMTMLPAPRVVESEPETPELTNGVTDCTECGDHIMVDDVTVPSQCEDGCDAGFMFHCNNCGQTLSDEFPNEDQHIASCLICGSDGHAECQHFDGLFTNGTVALESADGPMSGQYDDYDYAADEIKFAAMDSGTAEMCAHGRVVAIQDGQTYVCGDCVGTEASETTAMIMGYDMPELVDNMSEPVIFEALLSVEVTGVGTVSLGWQTITVPVGSEKSLATLYAEQSGSVWHKGGTPEWDSIITVVESYV